MYEMLQNAKTIDKKYQQAFEIETTPLPDIVKLPNLEHFT